MKLLQQSFLFFFLTLVYAASNQCKEGERKSDIYTFDDELYWSNDNSEFATAVYCHENDSIDWYRNGSYYDRRVVCKNWIDDCTCYFCLIDRD